MSFTSLRTLKYFQYAKKFFADFAFKKILFKKIKI